MDRASKLLILFLITDLIIFTVILITALIYSSKKTLVSSSENGQQTNLIYKDHKVWQKFQSTKSGLDLILVRLKNFNFNNTDEFNFYLKDDKGQVLREVDLSGRNIGDEWVNFKFAPLSGIAGQNLWIELSSTTLDQSQAISVYQKANGQIDYKAYVKQPIFETVADFLKDLKQRFLADLGFGIFYLIFLITLVLYLFIARFKLLLTKTALDPKNLKLEIEEPHR